MPAPPAAETPAAEPSAMPPTQPQEAAAPQDPPTSSAAAKTQAKKRSNGKSVETLVIDTNVFVKAIQVGHIAEKFVTVPEVVQELRSRTSRDQYDGLAMKHGIKVMSPDAESLKAVMDFAKRTGDFASLALADMKVLALAFMLEKKANGMRSLRLEPAGDNPNISDRKMLASAEVADNGGRHWGGEGGASKAIDDGLAEHMDGLDLEAKHSGSDEEGTGDVVDPEQEQEQEQVLQSVANSELDPSSADEAQEDETQEDEAQTDEAHEDDIDVGDDDDDGWVVAKPKEKKESKQVDRFFGGGWITPKNVKQRQAADTTGLRIADAHRTRRLQVACITSDFAMQNLMLKMGINLVTSDGVKVSRLRTWVLRCHACYQLTGDMNKQFCGSCGHPTLKRCSVTTGANGKLQVHLKSNYHHNLRGTIYSIPKPHGGQHTTKDVIVREDDRAYTRAVKYKLRMDEKTGSGADLLADPDFIPDMLVANPLAHGNGYGVASDARGMPMVARNRRNPNVVRNTGNRRKKRLHI
ncbi:20S-pre-rRNA D-site endonuclease nob1 [Coemansia biformis]|uniref:20S-pre-rRNA D-site endonuclease NOB1 n=1 Tax=Coemansia biformis TaxID=1286918 RepID=A0A9W7Y9M9_9FUNG|nr:20S-pre-rRNA D-site endonuclease nob1 [Coemansia biformis]